ncbi:uncharacterized protein LOC111345278 isoform X1 [Stylophora pistillata]|uniref:uncharacterized protein LOC111345278 isoform X1 n=1 Tax=Stylophora pistillata TaxID=50429 RepID=UPI000C03F584|nr:uncharacterized protein LOC111345278 isoform X1 [Stylophora pistillata]
MIFMWDFSCLVLLGSHEPFKGVSAERWGWEQGTVKTKKTYALNAYLLHRDRITDKGDTWNLPEAGAFITFCPGIMKEPLWVCCSIWNPRFLSPPIHSNELLVSNVIELSPDGPPTLDSMEDATESITVGLLHSSSDFKGYEVVIKKLLDPENNEWYDLETRIVWDTGEMRPAISKWKCPYAEASSTITRFSSFAVIWRLKSFRFPKPNSMTPEFICSVPDYPNVSIVIPWNSVPYSPDFCLTLKIQEPPSIDHKSEEMLVGPILHILCSHEVNLLAPAKIKLPLEFFKGKRELVHSGQWRVFHFQQEWVDITDQLEMSVSLTGGIATFKVKAFCRFLPLIADNPAVVNAGDVSDLDRRSMRQRAGFLACICLDDERFLLKLFCFPLNWKSKVHEYISSYNVIYQGDGNSKKPLFNEDQTFVSLSEGLKVLGEKISEDLSLTFFGDGEDQENVYVTIKDKRNMSVNFLEWLNAEERRHPESICNFPIIQTKFTTQDLSLSSQSFPQTTSPRQPETIASSNITGRSQSEGGTRVNPRGSHSKLKVSLLASEWNSLMGGLSTINRHLAIQLGSHKQVEVTFLVPPSSCSEEEKRTAKSHNVNIREVQSRPGYNSLDCLISPPKDLAIDIVVGHGQKLGKQAQFITESHGCKWIQVVHTSPEDLGMHKDYPLAIQKGEEKKTTEAELCKLADAVVAIGPNLGETFSAYLRSCGKQQDIIELTPGIFSEFSTIKHAEVDNKKFRVLTFGRGDQEDLKLKGYDIAAEAIAKLSDPSYCLIFVGAHDGKQEDVKKFLLPSGIPDTQLTVRKFVQSKEKLDDQFCEVDLCIMPSRAEGFGLTALEALSAGLPILVSGCSGFGEALCTVPSGEKVVVRSKDPEVWARAISGVRQKERSQRLEEVQHLRSAYEEKYSWGKQCENLVEKMWDISYGAAAEVSERKN